MKKVLLVISLLIIPLSSQANFGWGMMTGMALSGGGDSPSSSSVDVKDGGKPCFISLKSFNNGETYILNANYIEAIEEQSFEFCQKKSGWFGDDKTCTSKNGIRISLVNQGAYRSISSVNEVQDQIKSTCSHH